MMRIPARFYNVVFGATMALTMSSLISAVLTAFNTGGLNAAWLNAYAIALPMSLAVALPVGLTMMPVVRKFVDRVVAPAD